MRWICFKAFAWTTTVLLCVGWMNAVSAQTPQNDRMVLMRSAVGSSGMSQTTRLDVKGHLPAHAAAPVATVALGIFPGPLAPFTDRFGLITPERVRGILLGAVHQFEPLAMDAAGNGDGRIDVADLVRLVLKGIEQ